MKRSEGSEVGEEMVALSKERHVNTWLSVALTSVVPHSHETCM
jgi:hypothetical protein